MSSEATQVEAQMAALRPSKDPPDNETLETLLWLWDYHDRIKDTRDSMVDLKGILNLVNTLLIPLLAFLIANRETILELLGSSPEARRASPPTTSLGRQRCGPKP